MFDHNPKLDRWGNAMEFINGVAAGAVNPFLSAGEAVGLVDALYGTGYAIDKATMYGTAPLSAEGKLTAIGGLGNVAQFGEDVSGAAREWAAENPNAAETVEATFNIAAAAKAAKMAKTGAGKATVSEDFADSYAKNNRRPSVVYKVDSKDLDELRANGIKFNPGDLLATGRTPSGKVVFLEKGNAKAGLEHIIKKHESDFARIGVSKENIPTTVMEAVTKGIVVGYQGQGTGRPIYEIMINGQKNRIAVTTGSNGFIVGANPAGKII